MKPKFFYALAASDPRGGLFRSKLFVVALILALLLTSFPATTVFAASARPWENVDLKREWKNKLDQLSVESLFYNQVRFYPQDFEDFSELAQAWDLLHKHGLALRQANTVLFNHSGFDFDGNVTNERLAYESVHALAIHLQTMRGLRMKIAEAGYNIHRVR